MKVTVCVKKGVEKNICEDSAAVDGIVVNSGVYCTELETPHLICVADGVGGNAGGKNASCFVCNSLSNAMFSTDNDAVRQQLLSINTSLIEYAYSTKREKKMATTLTGVLFTGDVAFLVHVGNTRLYTACGKYLQQLTKDHTTHQWLIDQGYYEEAELRDNSEITCCFGGGEASLLNNMELNQVFQGGLPNLLFLTSDGIHDYIDIDRLEELLLTDQDDSIIVQSVIAEAEKNESRDDKTIIILRL